MNEIWEMLGIAPTDDRKAIRSAYSAKSKQCHPEENPEEFRKLHEAYQAALAFAAGRAKQAGMGAENIRRLEGRAEKPEEIPDFGTRKGTPKEVQGLGTGERIPKEVIDSGTGERTSKEVQDSGTGERTPKEVPDSGTGERTSKEVQDFETEERTPNEVPDIETGERNPEKTLTEQPDKRNKDQFDPSPESSEPAKPSLLSLLEQAEEEEFEKSLASGALKQFHAILNDPKKFRKADAWKAFFLSEEFLREQYSESFANGMLRILKGFHTEDNYTIVQMPSGFLLELAIAYALVLNPEQGNKREMADSFYAREVAASIWNMQQTQFSIPVRTLFKPENQVRMRSFADYIRLKNFNSRGLLTQQNKDMWEEMLRGGHTNYLYELKGRGTHDIYPGSRSVCSLELYAFWLRTENVPKCILEYMYEKYDLRGVGHTSTRRLYEPLKKEIIRQYPDIEDTLYGEEGRAKLVSAWYRELMQIISDSETLYEETEEIKERVRALFAREEWEKVRFLPELFERMYLQLHNRSVMPASIAKRLYEFYSQGTGSGAWDAEQNEIMVEGMLHSLYYGRMVLDMHGKIPNAAPYFQGGKLREIKKGADGEEAAGEICTDFKKGYPKILAEQDFWHYFLMRGFGCWNVLMGGGGRYRRGYTTGMRYSLTKYVEYLYQPSKRWQKLFTGAGRTNRSQDFLSSAQDWVPMPEFCRYFADESGIFVPGTEFSLPDGHRLRAQFYLHYVRYFLDGEEVFLPVYRFGECVELAESLERAEQFFLLLAITEISKEDFGQAVKMIGTWASRLPLAPVSIPVIARLLAGRSERIREDMAETKEEEEYRENRMDKWIQNEKSRKDIIGAGGGRKKRKNTERREGEQDEQKDTGTNTNDSGDTSGTEIERNGEEFGRKKKNGEMEIFGIYYMEEDELCFRTVVRESGFTLSRLNNLEWQLIHNVYFRGQDSTRPAEEKKRMAQEFLRGTKRPAPVLRSRVLLGGLENEEKAEKILEALKQDAIYRQREGSPLPYKPGYPWEKEDIAGNREDEMLCENGEEKKEENADMENSGTVLQRFYRQYGGFLSESYCVLHFGEDDTQDRKVHVFYGSMKPFGFSLASRSVDWPSSYEYREKELNRKVKEKHWVIGHFGWGGLYGPNGEAVPKIVALGESGTYYYYDVVRLLRGENLAALLAKMFDFSRIIAVENYEGNLSISRFGGELEYCYDKEAFLHSAYTLEKTGADLFTIFTKAEMMEEFAAFVDSLPGFETELFHVYFEFLREAKGIYSMHIYSWVEEEPGNADRDPGEKFWGEEEWEFDEGEEMGREDFFPNTPPVYENLMPEINPLVWKIWQQDGDFSIMLKDFYDVLYWYMDCGRYGKKLAGCRKITVGFAGAGEEGKAVVSTVYEKEEEEEIFLREYDI